MELREYWSIIRRHWWLPAAITLVALIVSTVLGLRGAAAYKTDMRLAVSTIPTPDPNAERFYDSTYYANLDSEYLADDMSEFMTSRAFADEVKRELATSSTSLDVDIDAIMSATRAKKTHRFIDITVTTPTFDQRALVDPAGGRGPRRHRRVCVRQIVGRAALAIVGADPGHWPPGLRQLPGTREGVAAPGRTGPAAWHHA